MCRTLNQGATTLACGQRACFAIVERRANLEVAMVWATLLLVISGCAAARPGPGEGQKRSVGVNVNAQTVRIRVGNSSKVDFDRVVITFPSQQEEYGRVPAGERSDYRDVTKAFRYARIEVSIGG